MYFPFQPVFVQPVFSAVHGPNKLKPANGSGGSKLANFWLFTFGCSCKDPSVDLRSRSLRLPRPTSMEWSKTNKANRNFAWQSPQRSMARNELGKRRTNSRPHVYNPSWIWHRSARNAALALRKTCEFWHQVKTKNRNLVAWHWLEYLHKFSPQVWTTFHFCSFRFVAQWVSNHARVHIFALFSKRQQWNKWTTPVGHQLLFWSRSCSQICSFVFTLSNTCENSGDKGQHVHRFYLCNLLLKPQSFVSQIRTPKSTIQNPKTIQHPKSGIPKNSKPLGLTARPLTLKLPWNRTFLASGECIAGHSQALGLACLNEKGGPRWAKEFLHKKRKQVDISHDMRTTLDETHEHKFVWFHMKSCCIHT